MQLVLDLPHIPDEQHRSTLATALLQRNKISENVNVEAAIPITRVRKEEGTACTHS